MHKFVQNNEHKRN